MRLLLAVAALWLLLCAPAAAASCTVGEAACPDLQAALTQAAAQPDADVVRLRADEPARPDGFRYTGDGPLELLGEGPEATRVPGPLRLEGSQVGVRGLTLTMPPEADADRAALEARGLATRIRITGEGSGGGVAVEALGDLALHDTVVDATGLEAALDAPCGAELRGFHATLAGTGEVGGRACGTLRLVSSAVTTGYEMALGGPGSVSADHSSLATDPSALASDLRPAPGSPLIDAGDPAPLAVDADGSAVDASEPQEDLAGEVRIADGDGDGRARRDIGAHEVPAASLPVPAGNVLVNPDAEAAGSGPPPGWTVTGGFTTESYGVMPFPTLKAGAALGGGARFLAGGASGDATATQVIDLAGAAASVDTGGGRATFSGLLGGFRADGDTPSARAVFRGPSGVALATLELPAVDAAARGNATHLLARRAEGAIPALARSVEVTLRGAKAGGGSYTDAYFDNLGLTLALPGAPGGGPDDGGGDEIPRSVLRPFSGIAVLSGSVTLSRRTGRARLLVGCASATVARCTGDLALAATLVRGRPRAAIGRARISLAPGAARRVSVRLSSAARGYLRRHSRLRVRVASSAVDGQGVRRLRTVPISVRRQRGR